MSATVLRLPPSQRHIARMRATFDDVMRLVERAAKYVDGPHKAAQSAAESPRSILLAVFSMRLTTEVLELAGCMLLMLDRHESGTPYSAKARRNLERLDCRSTTVPDACPDEGKAIGAELARLQPIVADLVRVELAAA